MKISGGISTWIRGYKKDFHVMCVERRTPIRPWFNFTLKNCHEQAATSTLCGICDGRYATPSSLKRHVDRVNTRERELVCTIKECNSSFYTIRQDGPHTEKTQCQWAELWEVWETFYLWTQLKTIPPKMRKKYKEEPHMQLLYQTVL